MSVTSTPSTFHFCCAMAAPRATKLDCWPDALPPTFWRSIATPADCSMMTHGSRADGMLCRASCVKRFVLLVSRKSTIGVSPDTVTVSSTEEISSDWLKRAFSANWIRMPSLMTVLKPASSYLSVYVPTPSPGNWNDPVSLVTAVSGCRSLGPVRLTVTPGRIAPLASVTLP